MGKCVEDKALRIRHWALNNLDSGSPMKRSWDALLTYVVACCLRDQVERERELQHTIECATSSFGPKHSHTMSMREKFPDNSSYFLK